jgi:hypothetical protein
MMNSFPQNASRLDGWISVLDRGLSFNRERNRDLGSHCQRTTLGLAHVGVQLRAPLESGRALIADSALIIPSSPFRSPLIFLQYNKLTTNHSSPTGKPLTMAHSSDLAATLRLSQQVPAIIGRQSFWTDVLPLSTAVRENPEEPETIEQLFFACLQTGDDKAAQLCLDRLAQYFGASNERVTGLQGLYEEATAEGQADLEKCLEKYNGILSENPVNVVRCIYQCCSPG